MSDYYYAKLIAGVGWKDAVTETRTDTSVTRYNEITGVPYQINLPQVQHRFGNKDVGDGRRGTDRSDVLSCARSVGLVSTYEKSVFGVLVHMSDPYDGGVGVSQGDIDAAIKLAKSKLEQFGLAHLVRLYLVCDSEY